MSFLSKIFGGSYDDLWQAIIRPPRDHYSNEDLGLEKFSINGKYYKRTDFTIQNKRNLKLSCSWWEPFDEEREYKRLPCVIYLHGNSSSKAEASSEAKLLLPMNVSLFAFDFAGCGRSEGEFISLGWYEREDVECIVDYLRRSNKVSTIGLWGRSMGAVTSLMYGDSDPSVAGMVLDSPFSSLKMLVEELVKDKVSLPSFVLNQAIKLVKNTVHKKANFNLDDIEPINYAKRCFIPALFTAATDDDFVRPHHSKLLYDSYQGDKNIIMIEGDHNSIRSKFFKDSAAIFFYNCLQVDKIKEMSEQFDNKKTKIIQPINIPTNKDNDKKKEDDDDYGDEEEIINQIIELSKNDISSSNKNKENK